MHLAYLSTQIKGFRTRWPHLVSRLDKAAAADVVGRLLTDCQLTCTMRRICCPDCLDCPDCPDECDSHR